MAVVEGLQAVLAALEKAGQSAKQANVSVAVGYASNYGIYVHEIVTAHHEVGQAKFLEQPAIDHQKEIAQVVRKGFKDGLSMEDALLKGGLYLIHLSMPLVPVDTGNLRASWFVEPDSNPGKGEYGPQYNNLAGHGGASDEEPSEGLGAHGSRKFP